MGFVPLLMRVALDSWSVSREIASGLTLQRPRGILIKLIPQRPRKSAPLCDRAICGMRGILIVRATSSA